MHQASVPAHASSDCSRPRNASSLANVLDRVYLLAPRGIDLGLERVREACARAGDPQESFPVIHVAGTNGKGSVAAMASAVLACSGYRVGLFTSPHLARFAERIRINGQPITDEALREALEAALCLGPELSFFEISFVAAMLSFRAAKVDVAVLEVGLGGRLDATNVVRAPLVTGVTRIAMDHTSLLGDTLACIAAEKAAIAKSRVPMVLGPLEPEADDVARSFVERIGGAGVYAVGREVPTERRSAASLDIWLPDDCEGPLELVPALRGRHQLDNAATAAALCALAGRTLKRVNRSRIAEGIATVRWPARLEMLHDGQGDVLLDAAHNPDGARALADYVSSLERGASAVSLVFGAMEDKAWQEMLTTLSPLAHWGAFASPRGRRAAPVAQMLSYCDGACFESVSEALKAARAAVGPAGLVVVAGSIFLAAEARAQLLGESRDPPIAL